MHNDVTFVTSVYDELSDTVFSGRLNRGSHYAFSLSQISKINAPTFCYTDNYNLMKFIPCLLWHGADNFRYFNYDLSKSPYHQDVIKIKNGNPGLYLTSPAWIQRCVEIMWGKFDCITHAAENIGIEQGKYLYWIDAGLAHDGILPSYYNSNYKKGALTPASLDYQHRFYYDKIFNDKLPQYLVENTGVDKLLFFFCITPQHNDPSTLPKHFYTLKGTAVGGLFGGDIVKMYDLAIRGKEYCKQLISDKVLVKEEDILTHIVNENIHYGKMDEMTLYKFKTWYHEDWGKPLFNRDRGDTSFADFFKGML